MVLLGLARLGQPRLLRAAVLLQGGLRRRRALHQAIVVRPAHEPQHSGWCMRLITEEASSTISALPCFVVQA